MFTKNGLKNFTTASRETRRIGRAATVATTTEDDDAAV